MKNKISIFKFMKLKNLLVIAFLLVSIVLTAAKADFVVALDGTGNFNKIQDTLLML